MHSVSIIEAKPGLARAHTLHAREGETRRCGARERERNRGGTSLPFLLHSPLRSPAPRRAAAVTVVVSPPFSRPHSFVRSFARSLSLDSPVCACYGLLSPHLTQLNQLADYFASRPRKARVTSRVPAHATRHPLYVGLARGLDIPRAAYRGQSLAT